MGVIFCFLPANLRSSTYTDKNNPWFSMNKKTFQIRHLFPIQVPTTLLRSVFFTKGLRVGDRTDFVQEEQLDLQRLTMISAIHVVEDVSLYLDNSDFGFFERLWVVLHSYLCIKRYCVCYLSCTIKQSCKTAYGLRALGPHTADVQAHPHPSEHFFHCLSSCDGSTRFPPHLFNRAATLELWVCQRLFPPGPYVRLTVH